MITQSLISLNSISLTDEVADAISLIASSWVKVRTSGTRSLISLLIDDSRINDVMTLIVSGSPIFIGAWDQAGALVDGYTFNDIDYKKFVADMANVHQFSGWAFKGL